MSVINEPAILPCHPQFSKTIKRIANETSIRLLLIENPAKRKCFSLFRIRPNTISFTNISRQVSGKYGGKKKIGFN